MGKSQMLGSAAEASRRGRWLAGRNGWLLAVVMAAELAVAGCVDKEDLHHEELLELAVTLGGQYDNTAQVQADIKNAVHPAHDAVALHIIPIDAPVMGKHAFYVQESAADDPRRVLVQRIWSFDYSAKGIVQTVATLTEPLRWRNIENNPDVVRSMMANDISPQHGCDVKWEKSGSKFIGSNDPKHCRSNSRATGNVLIETRIELDSAELAIGEIATDAAGQKVQGRTDDAYYRFRRQASP
ncbi:MAG TPA: chromophore lyase CpcT/CpeT [Steroidobacteraceae bacterium]|jgi:hypothetical protein